MIFEELEIAGVWLITPEPIEDDRGFFARSFCRHEFESHGLATDFVQCNLSYNAKKGTLRGMHRQVPPYEEIKIVSCMRGAIYDVALDVREDSPTFGKWVAVELSEKNHRMLYISKGMAHGFQTLSDDTLVYYQMGEFYKPGTESGIRYDDSRFGIRWPIHKKIMSDKDIGYKPFVMGREYGKQ